MTQKVLVFGDIGIDDTVALLYGYFKEEIEIVAVVADYGNISRENAIANINYVKKLLPQTPELQKVNFIAGASVPMTGELPELVTEIHGEYGLGPIVPPLQIANGVDENFYEVVEIIEKYRGELIIVNIGRLTSLATMFILYQSLMESVNAYYIMGGAFWVPGNITAVSEANFHGDPVAAAIVLNYANNVTIIPLNVTQHAIATPQMVNYIDRTGKIDILKPMLDYYYNFYKKRDPSIQGSPLHDVVTLMAIVHDDLLSYRKLPVTIIVTKDGVERGQSIADIRPYKNSKAKTHRIAFMLNYQRFYSDFMTVMSGRYF
ncbi:nucleoside hydrolase [Virgibacillus sp. SK37]|uniref:nucleoside hydrolase n=1 Tax=Virgibacillus sp. SK37 TaxID=403957 RepID=UPI0004D0B7F2|nr:nucleoside hydrolase [Virgibacillus sp. SK37]AIF44099.1 purine nucleoside phosphorylase [Virgibacillus sp. SK37]